MTKISLSLLLFWLIISGCKNQESQKKSSNNSIGLLDTTSLNNTLTRFQEASQLFNVSFSKPTTIKGKKGTVIQINPADLEATDGSAIKGDITVELKELADTKQMLANNIQTVCDGKLLVSGGAYFINLTYAGKQLNLKPGKFLIVQFPKFSDDKMSLFYGHIDSSGKINWQPAGLEFKSSQSKQTGYLKKILKKKSDIDQILDYANNGDTTTAESREERRKNQINYKAEQKIYDAMRLNSFGWINCDRFPDIEDKTDLLVRIIPNDSLTSANIFLVFKDIKSLMQEYYFKGSLKNGYVKFQNIPVDYKARLVAYSVKDGQVYSFSSDISIKSGEKFDLTFKPTSQNEFKSLIGK